MPNWVINELKVTADAENMAAVKALVLTSEGIDFNCVLPLPKKLTNGGSSIEYPNANVWCLENWGTKWNATEFEALAAKKGQASWTFSTGWTAPELWFQRLAEVIGQSDIDAMVRLDYASPTDWDGGWMEFGVDGAVERGTMAANQLNNFLGEKDE